MSDTNLAHLHAIAKSIGPWTPHPALTVNQATLRVVVFEAHGPEVHSHDIDECYVVLDGELVIEIEGKETLHLAKGDAYVVRAGTRHRPFALPRASILLVT
jgi:mannose-6-phosphate isomerase-like protein (cupin superfamily)